MRKSLLFLALAASVVVNAQEFNCKVNVIAPQIANQDPRIYKSLEQAVAQLMNTRRWTNFNYAPAERIDCNFLFTINEQPSIDRFKGTLQVIYSRPVYGTDLLSPVFDLVDQFVEFQFVENTQIDFTPDRFSSNLASLVAFYAYFILGVDGDTFTLNGGSDFYAQAQIVVTNAQNASESGWKAFEDTKNRYWLIDNQLQGVFRPLREFLYTYHRDGMDKMSTELITGRKNCAAVIEKLRTIHQTKPSSYNLQVFFNAKYKELVDLFKPSDTQEKTKVYNTVTLIDPGHIQQNQNMFKGS
jgi:hypothetical protein